MLLPKIGKDEGGKCCRRIFNTSILILGNNIVTIQIIIIKLQNKRNKTHQTKATQHTQHTIQYNIHNNEKYITSLQIIIIKYKHKQQA